MVIDQLETEENKPGDQQAIEAYQNQLHTPELMTQTFQAVWQARGELVGATYEVAPCPYTQEELADLEANGKRVGYLPAELATQQSRHILGKMFPKMDSHSVQKNNSVTNDENPSGWFDYESAIDAPYLNTTEKQLIERITRDGRKILSLNQYIVASQDSKLFIGHYLDEIPGPGEPKDVGTYVRLGCRIGGLVVTARFNQNGRLVNVNDWSMSPNVHGYNLGGRSSGVKKV